MSSFDLTTPVVRELRAAKPVAPDSVRERVVAVARREPEAHFALPSRFALRRFALVAVPACLVLAVGVPVIHGLATSGSPTPQISASRPAAPEAQPPAWDSTTVVQQVEQVPHAARTLSPRIQHRAAGKSGAARLAPSATRLQDYRASLTLRVDDLGTLSATTQKAMRTARGLGGYVVAASLDTSKDGSSSLVFRIPINRVQQAVARFSELGTITAQNVQIMDLQSRYDRLVKQIDALSVQMAKVDDKLADPSLTNEQRVRLQQRRLRLGAELQALTTAKGQTVRQARLATVSLSLTTKKAAVADKPHHKGTLGRALDDAGTILAKELSIALYALVIVGPIALLALLAYFGVRATRRHADRRLLETS